jgi:hypothetical protein
MLVIIFHMKRKKFLQRILNTQLKSQITKTFGEKSYVIVSNLTHIRSLDRYMVNVTLYIDDIENSMELYPDGLEVIIKMGWVAVGDGKPIAVSSSVDTIQD